ncbi:peptide chain release factor 1 [Xenorhabdus sp. DI]|uniref:protein RtxH n=1 Tax=Xenorhabdus doucetiae TaxID=351671 RepID=UPI0019C4E49F|nr:MULTISPECIES: peptide chain release factor 1 [unclassified Xenorhabdus]MBD2784706.1 peptide chain release factor 1 [Xenorhabdus sp. 3]MBD2789232.1 peptide chain release factor 1 [Xenorhabdus sp. DI]
MSEKFVQTVSSVNYNKGVFSLYFVGQEPNRMASGMLAENDQELQLKQVIHMPASGFMYMVSMVKSMLEDPRMEAEINKLIAAGFLPVPETNPETDLETNNAGEKPVAVEAAVAETAEPKKRSPRHSETAK